jgi:hypothetical protein
VESWNCRAQQLNSNSERAESHCRAVRRSVRWRTKPVDRTGTADYVTSAGSNPDVADPLLELEEQQNHGACITRLGYVLSKDTGLKSGTLYRLGAQSDPSLD